MQRRERERDREWAVLLPPVSSLSCRGTKTFIYWGLCLSLSLALRVSHFLNRFRILERAIFFRWEYIWLGFGIAPVRVSLYICIFTYINMNIYISFYVYLHRYVHICFQLCKCFVCLYPYIYVHTALSLPLSLHICVYMHIYICLVMHVFMYLHIY